MQDSTPDVIKYGIITQRNYDRLGVLFDEAAESNDWSEYALLAKELCEDNVPLFTMLFMRYDPAPHIFKEWKRIIESKRVLVRVFRGGSKSEIFTRGLITHRICYASVPHSKHEDPRVLAVFGNKDKIDDAMGSILRNVIEAGGPGNLIEIAFPAPDGSTIAEYARANGAWKNDRVDFPMPSGGVRKNPIIRCTTLGKRVAGLHPKVVIMDDAVEEIDARSELRRDSAWAFYQSVIRPMMETFNSEFYAPHTVYHEDDLNKRLEATHAYTLLEIPALNRMPSKDDYDPIYNDEGKFMGVQLTAKGRTLRSAWPCPAGPEDSCPATPEHYSQVGFHRPLKALLKIYHEAPIFFLQQFMHIIVAADQQSVKPWMLRYFARPGDQRIGKVAHMHSEWHNWRRDNPDAGLPHDPPVVEPFPEVDEIVESIHGWDFAVGKTSASDRTAVCRLYKTITGQFFAIFDAGRWRHDMVWRKVVTTATTDPFRTPKKVAVESNAWQAVWRDEVRKRMQEMGVQDKFVLCEVKRTKDKDSVFAASGLPETMANGAFFVDIDDEESINEIMSVTPDQKGGHDDRLDAAINAYMQGRGGGGLRPGPMC